MPAHADISNKVERLSHKASVACAGAHSSRYSKEELARATDKRLWVISNMRPDLERMRTAHTPNFAHLKIHKNHRKWYRLEAFKNDKGIVVLQSLTISHVPLFQINSL